MTAEPEEMDMRWLLLLATGCGDAEKETGGAVDCASLTPGECASDDSCTTIEGYPTEETADGVCADYSASGMDLGCMSSDDACDAAMSFGYDPANPGDVYSFGGCVPAGWEQWSDNWAECP